MILDKLTAVHQLDRIATALERIALALENAIPPIDLSEAESEEGQLIVQSDSELAVYERILKGHEAKGHRIKLEADLDDEETQEEILYGIDRPRRPTANQ